MIAAYRALIHAHIGVGLAYRARLTIWTLSSLFPLLLMAVWLAVVDEVGPAAGWGRTDFVSYYAAAALLYHTTTGGGGRTVAAVSLVDGVPTRDPA
jgi:ABC-2 type transport system permease protein